MGLLPWDEAREIIFIAIKRSSSELLRSSNNFRSVRVSVVLEGNKSLADHTACVACDFHLRLRIFQLPLFFLPLLCLEFEFFLLLVLLHLLLSSFLLEYLLVTLVFLREHLDQVLSTCFARHHLFEKLVWQTHICKRRSQPGNCRLLLLTLLRARLGLFEGGNLLLLLAAVLVFSRERNWLPLFKQVDVTIQLLHFYRVLDYPP